MLKRKIDSFLKKWKDEPGHNPLIIKGQRQCGKTFSVLRFGRDNYQSVIYLNFIKNPNYNSIFSGSLEVDDLITLISIVIGGEYKFIPGKTLIIFDEIQDCPEARTSLKFFKEDGRFDVICTGSLLGVKGYGKQPKSVPVGSETLIEMKPLDFEEFLWANNISSDVIGFLKEKLDKEEKIPEAIHNRMMELLLRYVVIGGMPSVVQSFVNNKQINLALNIQRDIIASYEDDMVKYADNKDKPLIRECFNSIPKQLAKENKKFQYSLVKKGGTSSKFLGSIEWIEDAGIILRCYNLTAPELPLDGNAVTDVFKVYISDTGLFISMLEDGTQFDILNGNLFGYKGAIFENLIADIFSKMGRKLYYFHKDSGLEIDFVMRYKGEATLVEVKAKDGNTKSSRTVLNNYDKYHVKSLIKLGNYNIGRNDNVLTLPLYLAFLLKDF